MPWHNGDFPPSYKNLPRKVREKAVEIANALIEKMPEGEAIATALKHARQWIKDHPGEPVKQKSYGKADH